MTNTIVHLFQSDKILLINEYFGIQGSLQKWEQLGKGWRDSHLPREIRDPGIHARGHTGDGQSAFS